MAFIEHTITDTEKDAVIAEALSTPEGRLALMLAGKNPMGWTEIDEEELLMPLKTAPEQCTEKWSM